MPELIIIRGLPLTGKTTLATKLAAKIEKSAHFENDQFDGDHNICMLQTAIALKSGRNVILSNYYLRKLQVAAVWRLHRARADNVYIVDCLEQYPGVAKVPMDALSRMAFAWQPFPSAYSDKEILKCL